MPTRICTWKCNICGSKHKTAAAARRCEDSHPTAEKFTILRIRYSHARDQIPESIIIRLNSPGATVARLATYVRTLDLNGVGVPVQDEDDHD